MKPKLSIILPIYNVEKYLERCLRSLIDQIGDFGIITLAENWDETDHQLIPVKKGEDPFRTDNLPENLGYQLKMKDGVVYVYPNEEAASKDEPKPLPYPNLDTFLDDMNFLLALIAQGPV